MATDVLVLDVRLHGQTIGTLTRLPGDRNLFAFSQEYIDDRARATLSLSFKDAFGELITQMQPTQTRLLPFFSNLLPEGSMRDYLAKKAGVKSDREFYVAWALGRDLPGALRIRHSNEDSSWAEAATYADRDDVRGQALRFSLAGVELKFSAIKEATGGLTIPVDGVGGSWIVKLPSTRFPGVPENEFAMLELARRIGIDVPETKLIPTARIEGLPAGVPVAGDQALAIRRFDRSAAGGAIHMEDFAQVFGVYPERKYDKASYRNIAQVLWSETGEKGIEEFMKRLVFGVLIGNADMHLKNWSLIYRDRRAARLAPAYDFVATIPYIADNKAALTLGRNKRMNEFSLDELAYLAGKARLPEKLVLDAARETVARFHQLWRTEGRDRLPKELIEPIEAHVQTVPIAKD